VPSVTAIEKQRRHSRAAVYFAEREPLDLRLDVIVQAGLAPGQDLSDRRRAELVADSQRLDAIDAALRLLALRPRTEKDLRERLRRRALPRPAIDAAVERVRELGYLDDAAFARLWVESRQASTPRSRRALAFELGRKGVTQPVAAETVADVSDEDAAYEAARRRLRALRNLDRQSFFRRLGSFLSSRGFSYGVARTTIERCWREIDEDAEAL
jgi:regulatory protein